MLGEALSSTVPGRNERFARGIVGHRHGIELQDPLFVQNQHLSVQRTIADDDLPRRKCCAATMSGSHVL